MSRCEFTKKIVISWTRNLKDIEGLEEQWRALEIETANRTTASCFDWVASWYRHYGSHYGEPLLGIATMGDKIVGIAPLVARKATLNKMPVNSADFVGFNAESGEFLISDGMEDTISLFLESLLETQNIDVICLNGFEDDSKELNIVERFVNSHDFKYEFVHDRYAIVDLKDGYSAYFDSLTSKLRNNYKRHKRKITEAGLWEVEQLEGKLADHKISEGVERVFAVYDRSWKADNYGPLGEPHRSFYREVVLKFARREMISLSFLRLNDKDIAFVLWLVERNHYYDVMVSYDDAYASLSPGIFLMHEIIKGLPEKKIHTVISHGDRGYKKNWVTAFITRYRIFIFNNNFKGKLGYLFKFGIPEVIVNLKKQKAR